MKSSGARSTTTTHSSVSGRSLVAGISAVALIGSGVVTVITASEAAAAPSVHAVSGATTKAAKARAAKAKKAKKKAPPNRPTPAPRPVPPPAPNPPTSPAPDSATWYPWMGPVNNVSHTTWGRPVSICDASRPPHTEMAYRPGGADRPSGRVVSNSLSAQSDDVLNRRHLSGMVWRVRAIPRS